MMTLQRRRNRQVLSVIAVCGITLLLISYYYIHEQALPNNNHHHHHDWTMPMAPAVAKKQKKKEIPPQEPLWNQSYAKVPPSQYDTKSRLLDRIVHRPFDKSALALPIVYPLRLGKTPQQTLKWCNGGGEIIHAEWVLNYPTNTTRYTGIGPDAVPANKGGAAVRGTWPDAISKLSYVSILKNGHTKLGNTVGDLRQRLGNDAKVVVLKNGKEKEMAFRKSVMQWQSNNTQVAHAVFAVVRDPIDRFVSATCEEMKHSSSFLKQCLKETPQETFECAIHNVVTKRPLAHQTPQLLQLQQAVCNDDIGISLIQFDELPLLLKELGSSDSVDRLRDRTSSAYFAWGGIVHDKATQTKLATMCSGFNMTKQVAHAICDYYQDDVQLARMAGIKVSQCNGEQQYNTTRTFESKSNTTVATDKEVKRKQQSARTTAPRSKHQTMDSRQKDSRLLDRMVYPPLLKSARALPIVYPLRMGIKPAEPFFPRKNSDGCSGSSVVHAEWAASNRVVRHSGIGPDAVPANKGGASVIGTWPDRLSKLSYLSILKNGHTKLSNTVGDLRQRLGSATVVVLKSRSEKRAFVQSALQWQSNNNNTTDSGSAHGVFTVIRDPIDRFVSATCEEMKHSSTFLKQCLRDTPDETFDCALRYARTRQLLPHQTPQLVELQQAVCDADIAVSLVAFDDLHVLLQELGSADVERLRDRTDPEYFAWGGRVSSKALRNQLAQVCSVSPSLLNQTVVSEICDFYRDDVKLAKLAGMSVSLCEQRDGKK